MKKKKREGERTSHAIKGGGEGKGERGETHLSLRLVREDQLIEIAWNRWMHTKKKKGGGGNRWSKGRKKKLWRKKIYEKYPNSIKKEVRNGKTYFRVVDFQEMKKGVGELLTEVF
jgi:hypothetical protein